MGRGSGWIDIPLARDRSGVYDSDGIDGARQRPCGDTDNRNDHGDSQQPGGGRKGEGPSSHGSSIRSGSGATVRAPELLRGRYLLDPRKGFLNRKRSVLVRDWRCLEDGPHVGCRRLSSWT